VSLSGVWSWGESFGGSLMLIEYYVDRGLREREQRRGISLGYEVLGRSFLEGLRWVVHLFWIVGVLFKEWRTCSSWAWSGVGGLLRLCWRKGREMISDLATWKREKNARQETYLIASSNTLLRFLCVRAEHSRYLTALISLATWTACSYCMGCILR